MNQETMNYFEGPEGIWKDSGLLPGVEGISISSSNKDLCHESGDDHELNFEVSTEEGQVDLKDFGSLKEGTIDSSLFEGYCVELYVTNCPELPVVERLGEKYLKIIKSATVSIQEWQVAVIRPDSPDTLKDSGSLKQGTSDSSEFKDDSIEIHVTNCPKLPGVEGLEDLGGLRYLKINECPSLQKVDFKTKPLPGYSTLDSAGEEDSADKESYWLEQLNICIDAYPEKETSLMLPVKGE